MEKKDEKWRADSAFIAKRRKTDVFRQVESALMKKKD